MRLGMLVGALVGLVLAVAATPALAQTDEVFVDPDSPTGREYDIPFERARRDAAATPPSGPQSYRSRSAPLFGEGIEPPAAVAARRGADRKRRGARRAEVPESVQAAVLRPGAPAGGAGSSLVMTGAGLLVLALGAGAGLLVRRARG
jgi:hypothetical protein